MFLILINQEEPELLTLWDELDHCKLASHEPIAELSSKVSSIFQFLYAKFSIYFLMIQF